MRSLKSTQTILVSALSVILLLPVLLAIVVADRFGRARYAT